MSFTFEQLLDSTQIFSEKEKTFILEQCTPLHVQSKTELVSLGKRSERMFFIQKGCIRKYCIKDGEPITIQIATEGQFAMEYVSFMTGDVSNNTLETLEDCELLVLTKKTLEDLYLKVPKMNMFIRKLLEIALLNTGRLLNDFIMLSPEERYLKLVEVNPAILNRLPQHIIASNLGISATSLSRIRKRIATSN